MRSAGATCSWMRASAGLRKRAGIIDDAPAGQRAERGVEVIEIRVRQWQRHTARAELPLDDAAGRGVGAKAAAEPEQAAPRIEDAIAGAFEFQRRRQLHESSIRPRAASAAKRHGEDRLLVLPLAVPEARQHGLAVEHHRGIGGEDEIGQAWFGGKISIAAPAPASTRRKPRPLPLARWHAKLAPQSAQAFGSIHGLML